MNTKIALITGANKGIGKEIARRLGLAGMTVLIGARDEARGAAAVEDLRAAGIDAVAVRLDVTDASSTAEAAAWVESEYARLDVLVNNAGIAIDNAPASSLAVDVMKRAYETNMFGVVAVTQAFLPLLRKSKAGRIVNMSSGLGSLTQNSDPNWWHADVKPLAYNSSKAALNMFTIILAAELRGAGIKVNAADPGYTATDLNQNRGTRTVAQGAIAPVRLATLPDDGPSGGFFNEDGPVPW